MSNAKAEEPPRNMREVVQRKFTEDVIGAAAATGSGWLVLIMDERATRVISSALTMYDIMEQRITLVEQLSRIRQPFKEMDAIYLVSPTVASAQAIVADFESEKKSKYAAAHLFFLDGVGDDVLTIIQGCGTLCAKIKTFKEINLNFVASENHVYHMDTCNTLSRFHGSNPDQSYATTLARQLVTLCITLNEVPTIRFQGTSAFCREVATLTNQYLQEFKRLNQANGFWCHGDEGRERERTAANSRQNF